MTKFQIVEVFYALCVALFVFFGLCAMRELIIRQYIKDVEELMDEQNGVDN